MTHQTSDNNHKGSYDAGSGSLDPAEVEMARMVSELRPVPPRSPERTARTRARILAELDAAGLPSRAETPLWRAWQRILPFRRAPRPQNEDNDMSTPVQRFAFSSVVLVALIAVLLFGGAGTTVYASNDALPGDTLYGVKTTLEQTRASLARTSGDRADLYLEFADRRMDEITRLIEQGRYDAVSGTTAEYESHLNRAIAEIETVAQGDPARAALLAGQVSQSLNRYAQALSQMIDRVPAALRGDMQQALQTTQQFGGAQAQDEIEFTGTVSNISGGTWTVDGRTVSVTASTELKNLIVLGDTVKVHARRGADGSLTAREIERVGAGTSGGSGDDRGGDDDSSSTPRSSGEIEFSGVVSAISGSTWTVGGRTVVVPAGAEIKGSIAVGDTIKVHASPQSDGSLVAREIERAGASGLDDDDRGGDDRGGDDDSDDDNSGPGSGDDDDRDDNSGSGSGGDDDNSGSGSGDHDDDDGGDDNSGSGSGSDDDDGNDDNSGSGGDDDHDDD